MRAAYRSANYFVYCLCYFSIHERLQLFVLRHVNAFKVTPNEFLEAGGVRSGGRGYRYLSAELNATVDCRRLQAVANSGLSGSTASVA